MLSFLKIVPITASGLQGL